MLGAAVVGGAGVAAARLWGGAALDRLAPARAGQANLAGRGDWNSPLGGESAQVAQLLRRATFGAGPAELEKALSDGFSKTVDRLIETKYAPPPAFGGDAAGRLNVGQLQQWWVTHMLTSPTPFAERMTLFWHGHFTSDFRKVGLQTPFIYWQNLTWRDVALGDLRTMLKRVTTDPAMLRYLDLATSTGASPNENYSRELMELFTMGPGNYTEDDVRAAAKGLAGWVEPRPAAITPDQPVAGTFAPQRAYKGAAFKYLGKTAQWNTDSVLDQILAQTATFVSATAYRSLVKSPTEFMVHALRALGAQSAAQVRLALAAAPNLGQVLFDPPDVGGWPNNEAWISSNTVVGRVNFVSSLLDSVKAALPSAKDAHRQHLDGVLSPQTAAALNQATDDHNRWLLVLASPEFQLK